MHACELVDKSGGATCQLEIQPAGLAIEVLNIIRCVLGVDNCNRTFPLLQLACDVCHASATALQKLLGAEGDKFFEDVHDLAVGIIHLTKHIQCIENMMI